MTRRFWVAYPLRQHQRWPVLLPTDQDRAVWLGNEAGRRFLALPVQRPRPKCERRDPCGRLCGVVARAQPAEQRSVSGDDKQSDSGWRTFEVAAVTWVCVSRGLGCRAANLA